MGDSPRLIIFRCCGLPPSRSAPDRLLAERQLTISDSLAFVIRLFVSVESVMRSRVGCTIRLEVDLREIISGMTWRMRFLCQCISATLSLEGARYRGPYTSTRVRSSLFKILLAVRHLWCVWLDPIIGQVEQSWQSMRSANQISQSKGDDTERFEQRPSPSRRKC